MVRPDFTGDWRFDAGTSRLEIPVPVSASLRIRHSDPEFRLERTLTIGDVRHTFAIELTTDGVELDRAIGDARVRGHAFWDGDALVFDARVDRGTGSGRNVVRYELDEGGHVLIARERFESPALTYENSWVFRRD